MNTPTQKYVRRGLRSRARGGARLAAVALVWALAGATASAAGAGHGHRAHHGEPPSAAAAAHGSVVAPAAVLGLHAEPQPLAARFSVTVSPPRGARQANTRSATWTFTRNAQQVALQKGDIDETWHRDAAGRIRFERTFHSDERVVDYSPGELTTLNVQADWHALSTFIDPNELRALKRVSRQGRGAQERLVLSGRTAVGQVHVEWLPALQLPAKLVRTSANGSVARFELVAHHAQAPAGWPQPGERSAAYLRLDAADFGDMEYDSVVKKSEALDIRLGWRATHGHE